MHGRYEATLVRLATGIAHDRQTKKALRSNPRIRRNTFHHFPAQLRLAQRFLCQFLFVTLSLPLPLIVRYPLKSSFPMSPHKES